MTVSKEQSVLIVGAGAFGLSTALHLLQRDWKNVTIIDRSPILPAPDAASTDIAKVVRSCYDDSFYTRFAREAIATWKDRDEWGDAYHESGVLFRGVKGVYADLALQNDLDLGANIKTLHSSEELRAHFPYKGPLGPLLLSEFEGYIAYEGGWANATQGLEIAMEKVRQLGGCIESGKPAIGLTYGGRGVKLEDGTEMRADVIVVASGSWTASSFTDLGLTDRVLATGHSIATIQLSEEEAKAYADVPVVLDFISGITVFPPNASNVVKVNWHSAGCTNVQGPASVSTPRTHVTHPGEASLTRNTLQILGQAVMSIYPAMGKHTFATSRMCWYTDTPDSDWLIDFHPDCPSVLFATGGSGHAYKFLPVLGRLVADRLENNLDPALAKKFAFNRVFDQTDPTRHLQATKELDISQLCSSADFGPINMVPVGEEV